MEPTDELLKQRGTIYGDIRLNANCQAELKATLKRYYCLPLKSFQKSDNGYESEAIAHRECLEYILEKLARIVTGTQIHEDNYNDIKGYAELARKIAMGESTTWDVRAQGRRMMFTIPKGKIGVVVDGQFGSTGKGLIAAWIAQNTEFDFATTNASANAGHTAIIDGKKLVTFHLPMTSVVAKKLAFLNAGSIIDPKVLLEEVERLDFPHEKLFIHPRAAVITEKHVLDEIDPSSGAAKIASTQHGVGAALADKLRRHPSMKLAGDVKELAPFLNHTNRTMQSLLYNGCSGVMEIPQGFSLGINSGLHYPYVTSREISTAQAFSDAGLHPSYLGPTMMTLRTYPIRVGNLKVDGKEIGWSGPFYNDSAETSWEELGVAPEITTVTGRVRRVAGFSREQLIDAVDVLRPTHVFLNFVNYLRNVEKLVSLRNMISTITCSITLQHPTILFGCGPDPKDICSSIEDAAKSLRQEVC